VTHAAAEERKRSPLDAVHRRLGAKMGPFAGWEMPIEYAGTLSEHRAVREAVGVFDLTHLGKVEVAGPGARAGLQHALSGDLDRLAGPGAAQYTLCLTEDGTIVDDLIVYWTEGGYLLVPNAANWPKVADAVRASAVPGGQRVEVVPRPDVAVLAVQGPRAPELLAGLFPAEVAELRYMHHTPVTYAGEPLRLARSGYTGERGYELLVPGDLAGKFWEELFERGEPLGAVPAGLGARDTLRLEMGYPLHGNDISTQTDPFEARVAWAVAMGKPDFRGRAALAQRKAAGPALRLLVGLVSTDRLIPRHGMAVMAGGRRVGEVTSGTFSPTLRHGIALAYVERELTEPGTELAVDVRGRRGAVRVTRPPFVDSSPKDAPAAPSS
jgi:aminomethyltransferase